MLAPAHIGAAALAGAAVYHDQPILVGITVLAGLFPDIDQPGSLIGRGAFFISYPLRALFGHRSITHSLLGAAISAALLIMILKTVGLEYAAGIAWPWLLGYGTHILLDSMTTMGIPLFWPSPRYFGLRLGDSGGLLDWLITGSALFVWLGTAWGRAAIDKILFG